MFDSKARLRFAFFAFAALAVILFSGTGCKPSKEQAGRPEKITIAFPTTFNGALIPIAFVKGYFKEEGLDATLQFHTFGKQALNAMIEGKADLATVGDTPLMFAVMEGRRIVILAAIQTSERNTGIVARRDRGISKISDLKGKTIGVTRGTTSDFLAESLLIVHGVDRKQVRIINLNPDEMAAALSTEKVDAVSTWNPGLIQLQKELGDKGRTFYGETLYTETFCLTAGQDFVQKNPETIKKVLKALIRAETFTRQNPEESRRLVVESVKADKALLEEVWDGYTFHVTLNQALLVNLENQTRWALKNRLTKRQDMPNYLNFIYVDGLRAVNPEAVKIIR
jgi:ABC-type nitrate/sulfonate/bicarbonate transport system substrate-binding protein